LNGPVARPALRLNPASEYRLGQQLGLVGASRLKNGKVDGSSRIQLNLDWACSSVWLERTPDKREVDSSTLSRPTMARLELDETASLGSQEWGCSSAGRAPALHAGGHRFDPVHLHHLIHWGTGG
jgi:hypothetical protein